MRNLPMPWTSLVVFIGWQMLMGSVSLLSVLSGLLFAWGLPKLTSRFVPAVSGASKPMVIMRLMVVVLIDIIKGNVIVARLVLGPLSKLNPIFITVPVETDHPYVISLLASIITMTPGTVSAHLRLDGKILLIHALDVGDINALIDDIHQRYERPLLEIFES